MKAWKKATELALLVQKYLEVVYLQGDHILQSKVSSQNFLRRKASDPPVLEQEIFIALYPNLQPNSWWAVFEEDTSIKSVYLVK